MEAKLPSAVCVKEIPSFALRMAALRPRMLAVMRVLMARPAASSLALLMRTPEDKRSMAVVWFRPEVRNEFCAATALTLVLMTVMDTLLQMCLLGLQESNMRSCYLMIRRLDLKLEKTW
jgi:hypothetical protein